MGHNIAKLSHDGEAQYFDKLATASDHSAILCTVPHAGRIYPDSIFDHLQMAQSQLLRLEDRYADYLVKMLKSSGHDVLIAYMARAWLDLNRRPDEIDPAIIADHDLQHFGLLSPRTRMGLGVVPSRLSGTGVIYRKKWPLADIKNRITAYHIPWHKQISELLVMKKNQFGHAILLDIHSMPPLPVNENGHRVDMVVGNLHGRASDPVLCQIISEFLTQKGWNIALNAPYAGGYALERHGAVRDNIHALQIEVDRALYCDKNGGLREQQAANISHHFHELIEYLHHNFG